MEPRVIVVVEWGPLRAKKKLIARGERLRVGRLERADFVIPQDEEISGIHFEVAWDGVHCTMRDLGSASGTELNGERVEQGEVRHGDFIQAGETVFSVYLEGHVAPCPGRASHISPELRASALAALRAERAPLYAVVDAARRERISTLLNASPEDAQSLYEGAEGEAMADVAPYLVAVPAGSWLLERLVEEGWGDGWGIFLACRRPFQEIRRHLRRLLVAEVKATGERFYFRYYDPRALARLEATCSARQRQILFGEIEAFVVERDTGEVQRIAPER